MDSLLREAAWRIAAERPGNYELTVHIGEEVFTKDVRVSGAIVSALAASGRTGTHQPARSIPPSRRCPTAPSVESIAVTYPSRGVSVLG